LTARASCHSWKTTAILSLSLFPTNTLPTGSLSKSLQREYRREWLQLEVLHAHRRCFSFLYGRTI
jgi:hypothetical protein